MAVSNGQDANQTTFNNAFMSRTVDTDTVGEMDLANLNPASGPAVTNVQREINSLNSQLGRTAGTAYNANPTWSNNDVGSSTDSVKQRADLLTAKMNQTTGHKHTGAVGDGPQIDHTGVDATSEAFVFRAVDLTGVTGLTHNISAAFVAKVPSTSSSVDGVPVLPPVNRVYLKNATTLEEFEDGSGNLVYARLTNTGGVGGTWTMTFYSLVSGVETAYSFAGSNDVAWWYQELMHPLSPNRPSYSEDFVIPSENATADIIDASATQPGKVTTGAQSFAGVKTFLSAPILDSLTASRPLKLNGSKAVTSGLINLADSTTEVTGVLDETNGGTGQSTIAVGDTLYGSGVNTLSKLPIGADGEVLTVVAGVPAWAASSGGGGGGALRWLTAAGNSPIEVQENYSNVWYYQSGLTQELFAVVRVPSSYTPGNPIAMYVPSYSPDVTGTNLMRTVATLIRAGVDAITSTTNQHTSTNAAINLATSPLADKVYVHECDLSNGSGQINAVAVSPGDLILVSLRRGTDTGASDIRAIPDAAEVSFNA